VFRFRRPRHPIHALRRALAVLLAAAALLLAVRSPQPMPSRKAATVPVVVAADDLSPGTVLTGADLAVVELPRGSAPAGSSPDTGRLVGRTLAAGVRVREPLTDVRLVGAGLTALLPPGLVAAPVRVADLAVAVLVSTGDHVDVLATPSGADRADLVAGHALVLATTGRAHASAGASGDDAGVLLIAVDPPTAARLAAASTTSTVTVSLAPS
jgi:Flp pilus assembly protein CpaB